MTVYLPLLLPEPDAAAYLGISETKLREVRKSGVIRRRLWDGKKLYDRRDLDLLASSLPYEGEGVRDEAEEWLNANGYGPHPARAPPAPP